MHTIMILMALGGAIIIRWLWSPDLLNYTQRWQRTLFYFLFPPLLLLMTAIAVLGMGQHGKMLGLENSHLSYGLTVLFVGFAFFTLLWQGYKGARSRQNLPQNPQSTLSGDQAYILPLTVPYSAQMGWWHSKLVISEGLLSLLDQEQLEAVIAHEQAHLHYRDTFWFFWLGWIYQMTAWLPNSRQLWEELLLLRELRADWKAAQTVDPILLAESLVTVAKFTVRYPEVGCAALSCTANKSRLEERIEALINEEEVVSPPLVLLGRELVWSLTPLITMPWHHS
ncbi:peptidase M48 Ste24p [Halothece sp. PCC 7418]|uniref:M56 family metallopeptidase n=1 Tax=Halothece sp. (strain PCC 7418) TaxID=65093 RepID=UPI0002A0852A|nr:M56 family metallopeptidase [Halothece sp. PCC 7418]AFZ43029.1 peptidase M48 Ste24p [Halothece sp. PCC 7418]